MLAEDEFAPLLGYQSYYVQDHMAFCADVFVSADEDLECLPLFPGRPYQTMAGNPLAGRGCSGGALAAALLRQGFSLIEPIAPTVRRPKGTARLVRNTVPYSRERQSGLNPARRRAAGIGGEDFAPYGAGDEIRYMPLLATEGLSAGTMPPATHYTMCCAASVLAVLRR